MISGNTYEEVYEILSYMDKLTVMKIPENILQDIKTKRNVNFKTRIDKTDIFNEQNISEEAVDFLCWLDYQYWMSEERKLRINKISRNIMIENENENREKYNYKDIFKETKIEKINENLIIEYKEAVFKTILNKIKNIFKKSRNK